jgi:alpha-mannosidase
MKKDTSHIKKIRVVSNTHWDREFRRSFEKTRHGLLRMMDVTLDVLEKDPAFPSFTMDGHSIMIDDYLEMRPERKPLVESLIRDGRLVIGPYYTLAEEFSIGHEALVRNLMFGRSTIQKYGGKQGTVAYTPSSWGQTGQLPQILKNFGLDKMMFYRGISHHESDAEFFWSAPDGTTVYASRFALYARYNWYFLVHRAVTRGAGIEERNYSWARQDEVPVRFADGISGQDPTFELQDPAQPYDRTLVKAAIENMIECEGRHFTTDTFLGMNGHDISVPFPRESEIIRDAQEIFQGIYDIKHCDLEEYWREIVPQLSTQTHPTLVGERRSYLKEGMWTTLFPGTISARTYLKLKDFAATAALVYQAEPLAALASALGSEYPAAYLTSAWRYLLTNHTHDANGGCAPDAVCQDMEYRYRKVSDIADIVTEDAIAFIAGNITPDGIAKDAVQYIVFNPLPFERDAVMEVDLEIPKQFGARAAAITSPNDQTVERQTIEADNSSVYVDSLWELPTLLDTSRVRMYAHVSKLPALGYRVYNVVPETVDFRTNRSLATSPSSMENAFVAVRVNPDGSIALTHKKTGKTYSQLNYLTDQGESGSAWDHIPPQFDRKYSSLGVSASIAIIEQGPLRTTLRAEYDFVVPKEFRQNGKRRADELTPLPVRIDYTLDKSSPFVKVKITVKNTAKDHWLRANFATGIVAANTVADSHFDVIERPVSVPDPRGWKEEPRGVRPLRTFVDLTDGENGLALMPKGLFEFEAFEDGDRTLALTLIRACRIRLKVGIKDTELNDEGIQCPGTHSFEYAIFAHEGDYRQAALVNTAAAYAAPLRAVEAGRGKGTLPPESSLFSLAGTSLHVTAVKRSEHGNSLIIRLFNTTTSVEKALIEFGCPIASAQRVQMDETTVLEELPVAGRTLAFDVRPKEIVTVMVGLPSIPAGH